MNILQLAVRYGLHSLHRDSCAAVGVQALPGAHHLSLHLSLHQPLLDQSSREGDAAETQRCKSLLHSIQH